MKKQMFKAIIISILSTIVNSNIFSQKDFARPVVNELCSPEMHGRGYVNKGDSLAADYLAMVYKKLGAKPISGSYFQHFNFDVNSFPHKISVKTNKELAPGKDYIIDPNSGSANGTYIIKKLELKNIENWQKTIDLYLKDKRNTILFDANSTQGLSRDSINMINTLFKTLAKSHCPIILLDSNKFTYSVGRSQYKYPLIRTKPHTISTSTKTIQINIKNKFLKNYQSQNVIGLVEGKCKNKYTVVTAHYDHLGRMGKDTYFPGANDNASGTTMLLNLMKYYAENKPKNNIVFIAFGGEEAGLIGSNFYTQNPLFDLKKIKLVLNLDIFGTGDEGVTVVNATLYPKQFNKLKKINDKKNLIYQVKKRGPAANSDHYWFTKQNVPAFFIYTMGGKKHYHDVFDTAEELSLAEYDNLYELLKLFVKKI